MQSLRAAYHTATPANRLAAATVALFLVLAVTDSAVQTLPLPDQDRQSRPSYDHVVFPTGGFPADVQNVQAAADRGGAVLLKATNLEGEPMAFNFGRPHHYPSGYQVALQGDVRLLGETVGSARTTIAGGYRAIQVGVTGWPCCDSPVAGRVQIKGIDFDGSEQSAIDIYKAADVEIADIRISNVQETYGYATGINIFGGGEQRRITGTVVIRDSTIRYRAADANWSHPIVVYNVAADVEIVRNAIETTQAYSGILVVRQVEGTVRIAENSVVPDHEVPGVGDAGIYIYANDRWDNIRTSVPRYEVVGNHIVAEPGGIGLVGQRGSIDGAVITGNRVTTRRLLGTNEGIYFGGNVSNARVSHNQIDGAGAYGIDLFSFEAGQVADSNVFIDNELTFDAGTADFFLDGHTTNNTLLIGRSDTVIDLGAGNQIVRRQRDP
jgi:hypothetical protein